MDVFLAQVRRWIGLFFIVLGLVYLTLYIATGQVVYRVVVGLASCILGLVWQLLAITQVDRGVAVKHVGPRSLLALVAIVLCLAVATVFRSKASGISVGATILALVLTIGIGITLLIDSKKSAA